MRTPSKIRIEGDVAFVELSNGRAEAVVDLADLHLVSGQRWFAICPGRVTYAVASSIQCAKQRARTLLMHRVILGNPDARNIDHIDGNGLNNRKANLRTATHSENQCNRPAPSNNTSGFKGVSFEARRNKWRAEITKSGRNIHLGYFAEKQLAVAAWTAAAADHHGEYARVS